MTLLERTAELDHLRTWLWEAQEGSGRLVFLSGEMGIGKTTLVEHLLRDEGRRLTVVRIPFDGLSIPAPLGPLLDLARSLGHDIDAIMDDRAPRPKVFRAIESSLRATRNLAMLVAEDAHWADEASLEFVRFLGRRISSMHAMAIVTFRDDELAPGHPLRQVTGDLATDRAIRRLALSPLSVDAVRALAGGQDIDPVALHAYTGGNPFFVTEVLAAGTQSPITIRDAVLGRAARLGVDARETLETAAAIGMRVEPLLLAGSVGRPVEREIDAAITAGLLRPEGRTIAFRHAAVQAVIVEETSPARLPVLHGRILACLERHPGSGSDASRLAFHAEEAGNRQAAHRYALAAATDATRLQSHREAADQYARALRCADGISPEERATILEAHAFATFLIARMGDAIASQQQAAGIWQELGDNLRYGHNLRRLSRFWFFDGRYRIGAALAERSFDVLQAFPESPEFAMACGYLAEWRIRSERLAEARDLGDRSLAIANRLDDPATMAHALITVGMVRLALGDADGRATLDAGLDLAQRIGHEEFELRALTHLGEAHGTHRFRPESRSYAEAGLTLARNRDLSTMIALFGSVRLTMLLDACDWAAAIEEADTLIRGGGTAGRLLLVAHLVRARAQVRSGRAAPDVLEPARRHAAALDDPVAQAMATTVHLESAWLAGTLPDDIPALLSLVEETRAAGDIRVASELAFWLWRASALPDAPGWMLEPYASEARGNSGNAAAMWEAAGVPLEAFRARAASNVEGQLRDAHAACIALGADPDAARIAHRMHELGYRPVPRGPRPSTRQNPAGLSRREVDVLALLAEGASNREIAGRLSISPKTVDHHVSSIISRLGATNRSQAVACARRLGVLPE